MILPEEPSAEWLSMGSKKIGWSMRFQVALPTKTSDAVSTFPLGLQFLSITESPMLRSGESGIPERFCRRIAT